MLLAALGAWCGPALAGCRCPGAPPKPPASEDHPRAVAPLPLEAASLDLRPMDALERAALGGQLAFVRETAEAKIPHLVRPDGTSLRPLPAPAKEAFPAVASADGLWLAGVAVEGEDQTHREQLVVWALPGGEVRSLGPPSRRARNPTFSPDGRQLAFEADFDGAFSNLYVIGVEGGAPRRLTDSEEGDFEPAWAPRGGWVAFVSSRDGDPELYRIRPDGSGLGRLTSVHQEDVSPRWSPDGAQLAFLSNRGGHDTLFLMAADGAGQRRLVGGKGEQREHAWSPDGTRIAVVQRLDAGKARILLVEVAKGAQVAVGSGKGVDDMPAWSPDGRYLAFVSDRRGRPELFLVRADGTGSTPLLEDGGHDWLPVWVRPPG